MTTPVATRLSAAEIENLRAAAERRGDTTMSALLRQFVRHQLEQEHAYTFDRKGNFLPGQYDFSSDLITSLKHDDKTARHRVLSFMHAQFVTAANVAALNPTGHRADSYVPQRDFRYPLWSAVDKGTIPGEVTPFVLPKFASSSGLVGPHAEGVEPVPGAFITAGQTVTPSALSGKVEISREAWDQGGNPQLSQVVWEQMQRGWFEALETSVAALLEAAAPTTLTVTTAAVDAALDTSLTTQVVPLAFSRGGMAMRELVLQTDLYTRLVLARDTTGRRLFEVLRDSDGTDLSAVIVADGLIGKPGWALAPAGTVTANSYLFDRTAVSGWATPPLRLIFDASSVSTVEVAIWGYKAFAINDLAGVRRIAYDPA